MCARLLQLRLFFNDFYLNILLVGSIVVWLLYFLLCYGTWMFIFLAEELFNVKVDIVFFILLLDHIEFFPEFDPLFSVALSKRVPAKRFQNFGDETS